MRGLPMTKREKIIVFVMILTIIYGFYDLVLSRQFKKQKQVQVPVRTMVGIPATGMAQATLNDRKLITEISSVLKEDETVKTSRYIAARVGESWENDPFSAVHDAAAGREETLVTGLDKGKITYNGYVEIGSKKVAIINGTDYKVGDELEIGGYRIVRITESGVVLENKRMGDEIRVPFIEED